MLHIATLMAEKDSKIADLEAKIEEENEKMNMTQSQHVEEMRLSQDASRKAKEHEASLREAQQMAAASAQNLAEKNAEIQRLLHEQEKSQELEAS